MQCIGDECATPNDAAVKPQARAPLMRSVALGAICAGLGYFAAQSRAPSASDTHPAVIAPPAVLVSDIAD